MSTLVMGKAELARILDVVSCSEGIHHHTQLPSLTDAIRKLVPFEFVAVGQFQAAWLNGFSTTFNTYHRELNGIYQTVGYKYDPAVSIITSSNRAVAFNVDQLYTMPKKIEDVKRDFGIRTCLSMGVRGEHDSHSYFVCSNYEKKDERFLRLVMGLVAPHLHLAVSRCRLESEKPTSREVVPLSQTENEIVRWLSLGKSNWEISVITKYSERSIRYHLSNIFQRASVARRAELIAWYVHSGSQLIRRVSASDPSILIR